MLLVVLMPAVSRTLSLNAGMSRMGADCMMGMGHADHHSHGTPGGLGTPGNPGDPTAKCGFCTLLAHTPVMAFDVDVALVPAALPAPLPPAPSFRRASVAPLLSAQPRGPPRIG
jgi:hypothetical protein